MEGFLPRQLREEHPKGVALKVLDRTKMSFRQWLKAPSKSGFSLFVLVWWCRAFLYGLRDVEVFSLNIGGKVDETTVACVCVSMCSRCFFLRRETALVRFRRPWKTQSSWMVVHVFEFQWGKRFMILRQRPKLH